MLNKHTVMVSNSSFSIFASSIFFNWEWCQLLTLLHSEQPKLHRVLVILSTVGLKENKSSSRNTYFLLDADDPLYLLHSPGPNCSKLTPNIKVNKTLNFQIHNVQKHCHLKKKKPEMLLHCKAPPFALQSSPNVF